MPERDVPKRPVVNHTRSLVEQRNSEQFKKSGQSARRLMREGNYGITFVSDDGSYVLDEQAYAAHTIVLKEELSEDKMAEISIDVGPSPVIFRMDPLYARLRDKT